jgi:ubiquinone/menaquinone biosynthesis C-methylase UbiE
MKMSVLEKYFVNRSGHTRAVAERAVGLLDNIKPEPRGRYLDVGCGVGAAATRIASTRQLDVTGVDVDPQQIALAKAGPEHENLHFRVMDACRLDFPDDEFDIVATSMTTHHISNWERALSEMVRVLRSRGYFIYGDHVVPSWLAKAGRLLARFIKFPSTNAIDAWAVRAGLTKVYEFKRYNHVDIIWLKSA